MAAGRADFRSVQLRGGVSGVAAMRRFVCKKCGHVHATWSSRCVNCTEYGLALASAELPRFDRSDLPRPISAIQPTIQPTIPTPNELPPENVQGQAREPRPRLVMSRASSPDPELSPEELVDVVLSSASPPPSGLVPITEISETAFVRDSTGLPPLDHVLGGGLVAASVVLLASPPGIGKSSLTLQMLAGLGQRCLYVTGEETIEQIAGTARRVGALDPRLFPVCETDLVKIFAHAHNIGAQTIAIDSIQKMQCLDVSGRPGSTSQLKECTARLVTYAKKNGTAIWIIGHVTGEGDIAGPKTIEHDVDVVLELSQGAKFDGNERKLRCSGKNRFGPTNVVGEFELTAKGFRPIDADGWDEEL